MQALPPLDGLSHAEKDALIRALWQDHQQLRAEVEKLKQKRVKKTSRNSNLPPSKGFKPNQKPSEVTQTQASPHRPGQGGRELSSQPDQVVVARARTCPHCQGAVSVAEQQLRGIYERIDLPPVKPHITRVERYGGTCPSCQQSDESPVPVGLEPVSPYGNQIASLLPYLRYLHAVIY